MMHTDDLMVGATIHTIGEEFYVVDRVRKGKRGFEFRIRRGRQAVALWYSWRHVASWLASAEWVDNPVGAA
jgi:hypothetical protein